MVAQRKRVPRADASARAKARSTQRDGSCRRCQHCGWELWLASQAAWTNDWPRRYATRHDGRQRRQQSTRICLPLAANCLLGARQSNPQFESNCCYWDGPAGEPARDARQTRDQHCQQTSKQRKMRATTQNTHQQSNEENIARARTRCRHQRREL